MTVVEQRDLARLGRGRPQQRRERREMQSVRHENATGEPSLSMRLAASAWSTGADGIGIYPHNRRAQFEWESVIPFRAVACAIARSQLAQVRSRTVAVSWREGRRLFDAAVADTTTLVARCRSTLQRCGGGGNRTRVRKGSHKSSMRSASRHRALSS